MIKTFIKRIDKATTETWIAVLRYIDDRLDSHYKRLTKLEEQADFKKLSERVDDLEKSYNETKMKVNNDAENRKFWKRTFFTAIIGVIVTYLATQIGIV